MSGSQSAERFTYMITRIGKAMGMLGVSWISALAALFLIDRVAPSPIVLLPLLVTAPAIALNSFHIGRRGKKCNDRTMVRKTVFIAPLRITKCSATRQGGLIEEHAAK
jgi:hypothetical protein